MTPLQTAEAMLGRLAASAEFSLKHESLTRHDRFGYEADARMRPIHSHLVGLGWTVETSTQGSVYYSKNGERLRLSNHEVPSTVERDDATANGRWTWARCGWQVITTKSLDSCIKDIAEIEEAINE
jgi:hypothetical protein